MLNFNTVSKLSLVIFLGTQLIACGGSGSNSNDNTGNISPEPNTPVPNDTSPVPFSFVEAVDADLNTSIMSELITITGIDTSTPISISGGEYAVNSDSFTTSSGNVVNNDSVQVRVTSSSQENTTTEAMLTVGDFTTTFTVTTGEGQLSEFEVEAELSNLLGGATIIGNDNASNEQVVGNFQSPSDGVSLVAPFNAVAVRIHYTSTIANELVLNDGSATFNANISATSQNTFNAATVEIDVLNNATFTIGTNTANSDLLIDTIEWIDTPFQFVRTFADSLISNGDGLSVDQDGNVYVSGGPSVPQINKIDTAGNVTVFASGFNSVNGSAFDSQGNLFVADYRNSSVFRVTPDGQVTTLASNLDGPAGVFVDQQDNILVGLFGANFSGEGAQVLSITQEGAVSVLASNGGLMDVIGVVGDENGDIYAGNFGSGELFQVTGGNVSRLGNAGVNVNMIDYSRGYIYVANDGRVVRVNTSSGQTESFAGTGTSRTSNGDIASAEFESPVAVALSPNGNILYVYDNDSRLVRSISFADEQTTIATLSN